MMGSIKVEIVLEHNNEDSLRTALSMITNLVNELKIARLEENWTFEPIVMRTMSGEQRVIQ